MASASRASGFLFRNAREVNILGSFEKAGDSTPVLCNSPTLAAFGFLPESFGSVPQSAFPTGGGLASGYSALPSRL
jgi:hypothetical protein